MGSRINVVTRVRVKIIDNIEEFLLQSKALRDSYIKRDLSRGCCAYSLRIFLNILRLAPSSTTSKLKEVLGSFSFSVCAASFMIRPHQRISKLFYHLIDANLVLILVDSSSK